MKVLGKFKKFIVKHELKYKGLIILMGLILLYSIFIEPSDFNILFFTFKYYILVMLINSYYCYHHNNKAIIYKTSLGVTRKDSIKQLIIYSLTNLLIFVCGLFMYNLFIFLYVKKSIFSVISIEVLLQFMLLFIFLFFLSNVIGRRFIKLGYYMAILLTSTALYLFSFFYLDINAWIVNIILLILNIILLGYYKYIFNRNFPLS